MYIQIINNNTIIILAAKNLSQLKELRFFYKLQLNKKKKKKYN